MTGIHLLTTGTAALLPPLLPRAGLRDVRADGDRPLPAARGRDRRLREGHPPPPGLGPHETVSGIRNHALPHTRARTSLDAPEPAAPQMRRRWLRPVAPTQVGNHLSPTHTPGAPLAPTTGHHTFSPTDEL
ncbi:hypothetical protein T261_8408 [Streptomyces lydicus]|nr:hypothetical protein T261_8408 [Streptomyces lydicus]